MSSQYRETLRLLANFSGKTLVEFENELIAATPHTENGLAVAAAIFQRARDYWPHFHDPTDRSALAIWAEMFDTFQPFVTPQVAERAVDAVHAAGITNPSVGVFLNAARFILTNKGP